MQQNTDKGQKDDVYFDADVLIIGAGPAGLLLSIACAQEGLSTSIISKDSAKPWTNNYCFWKSELNSISLTESMQNLFNSSIEKVWSAGHVRLSSQQSIAIDAEFCKFNTSELQNRLLAKAKLLGVTFVDENCVNIEHQTTHSTVYTKSDHTESGSSLTAKIVVAANGSNSQFLNYPPTPKPAFQIAYGQLLDTTNLDVPWTLDKMEFMDFHIPVRFYRKFDNPPSFLYVLPLSENRVFVEETILSTRKAIDFEFLKNRLEIRKGFLNIDQSLVVDEEFCRIQMGGSLPTFDRTLGFGAAACFTHPVTGFQILRAIQTAPRLAKSLREYWALSATELSARAWGDIWTETEQHNRKLYLLGLDLITHFKLKETRSFFEAFFKTESEHRAHFLSGFGSIHDVQSSMWETFKHANWATRAQIVQHSAQHPSSLFTALKGAIQTLEQS